MRVAYPEIRPFARAWLALGDQEIYLEQAGRPDGIPLLFLHDGPGIGCHRADRRLFDPDCFHLLLPDQRGCGRSKPHLAQAGNHRQALCGDLIALRQQLGIERWVVAGAGWGGLLALTLALAEPERVRWLLLMGTGLGAESELTWLFERGAPQVFPEAYQAMMRALQPASQTARDILAAFDMSLSQGNEIERMTMARHWASWLSQCAGLKPQLELHDEYLEPPVVLAHASLACAYMRRRWDLPEPGGILTELTPLEDLPITCVHGRFDMISPLAGIVQLQRSLPGVRLDIVREAGHSLREASMIDAIVKAQNAIADACGARAPDCG